MNSWSLIVAVWWWPIIFFLLVWLISILFLYNFLIFKEDFFIEFFFSHFRFIFELRKLDFLQCSLKLFLFDRLCYRKSWFYNWTWIRCLHGLTLDLIFVFWHFLRSGLRRRIFRLCSIFNRLNNLFGFLINFPFIFIFL